MIPKDFITEWRQKAPWIEDFQVEQDLVISRALVDIFSDPVLADGLAFRGGTAIQKLNLISPLRYSEDIDLVQVVAGPAGELMNRLREVLVPWLGTPRWKQSKGRVTFVFRFDSDDVPARRLRLKPEINTREHFAVLGYTRRTYSVESRWYTGKADILTYEFDELLATKLRALYQRRKGRDLFDLAIGVASAESSATRIVSVFQEYMNRERNHVTRTMFEQNLIAKLRLPEFNADMHSLARPGYIWRPTDASRIVNRRLISRLPDEPMKELADL